MNYRLLSKLLGTVLFLVAIAMGITTGVAFIWKDGGAIPLLISFGITTISSILLILIGLKSNSEILRKEGITVVGLGWFLAGLFGMLPYIISAPHLSLTDAFFESVSGFTTTGSTVINNLDLWPRSILLWRSLTQWLGGIGILVLFVAVLSYLGVGSKALIQHESSAHMADGASTRIQRVALALWIIYLGITVACFSGLLLMGIFLPSLSLTPYDAVLLTLSTVSTGGFCAYNNSLKHFDNTFLELWVALFMIISSISFMIYALILRSILKRDWSRINKRLRHEEESYWFFAIIAVAVSIICIQLVTIGERTFFDSLRASFFTVTSIVTSGGFVTDDYDKWPVGAYLILLILFVIGGCAGSTAGGLKVSRIILLFKIARIQIIKAYRPNLVTKLKINGQKLETTSMVEPLLLVFLTGVIALGGSILIALFDPAVKNLETALSATLTTVCNIGPGLGEVGANNNFYSLHDVTKFFLSLLMVIGRLEFFAVLVLFTPSMWKKF